MRRTKMFIKEFSVDATKVGSNPDNLLDYIKTEVEIIIDEVINEARSSNLKVVDYKIDKPTPKFSKLGLSFVVSLDVTYEDVKNE